MKQTTEQNMINAFGGESMAFMRYKHFAEKAETDNFPAVARLFRAIADAEYIHAGDHYRELRHLDSGYVANSMGAFGPGDTAKNLGLAIAGENYEVEEMYPTMMQVADFQGEKSAYRSFEWSYKTEQMHLALYRKAKEAVDGGKDVELAAIQVCSVCGYTVDGEAPDVCPVCLQKKEKFNAYA